MQIKPIELTKEGKENFEKELDELINVKKPEVIEKINAARAMGDLSENADYKFARDEQAQIESRISELEAILENCVVVNVKASDKTATLGKTVIIKRLDNNKEIKLSIVSNHEADALSDPTRIKVSTDSPIGTALLGHKKGDIIHIPTIRPYDVTILEITVTK